MMTKKLPTPPTTLQNAKDLRTHSTEAEKLLWSKIRNRQILNLKFRRQQPIPPYIVDFYCEDRLLIIELDGGQHNEDIDRARTDFLNKKGYQILRYWNNDVLGNIDGVMEDIMNKIGGIAPPPPPPPPGGGGEKKKRGLFIIFIFSPPLP